MKQLIDELQIEIPLVRDSMLAALGHVVPSHLFDGDLFNFGNLGSATGNVREELDAVLEH